MRVWRLWDHSILSFAADRQTQDRRGWTVYSRDWAVVSSEGSQIGGHSVITSTTASTSFDRDCTFNSTTQPSADRRLDLFTSSADVTEAAGRPARWLTGWPVGADVAENWLQGRHKRSLTEQCIPHASPWRPVMVQWSQLFRRVCQHAGRSIQWQLNRIKLALSTAPNRGRWPAHMSLILTSFFDLLRLLWLFVTYR